MQHVGRALLVVLAEHREAAGEFFKQYLLPRREATRELIAIGHSTRRNSRGLSFRTHVGYVVWPDSLSDHFL